MIFFFDRSIGSRIPRALRFLKMPAPIEVKYHDECFRQDEPDDSWLPKAGAQGWIVIGFDYQFHNHVNELAALKQYNIGCFYLWGSQAPRWEAFRVFARAFDRVVDRSSHTPRPFIYRINKDGRLVPVRLP